MVPCKKWTVSRVRMSLLVVMCLSLSYLYFYHSFLHLHGMKFRFEKVQNVYRDLPDKLRTFPIVGYGNADTPNCTHHVCHINRGRTPVRMHEKPPTCHNVADCITLITKTRFRLDVVAQMIQSFRHYHPHTHVIVVDDFNPDYRPKYDATSAWAAVYLEGQGNVTYLQTEGGIAEGRNTAMRLATTKYALLADDDILFTEDTDVPTMLRLLEETDASIVGGTYDSGVNYDFLLRVSQDNDSVTLGWYSGIYYESVAPLAPCYVTDCVHNFFLLNRVDIIATGAWDKSYPVYEHEDFFLNMRIHGIKILYCPNIFVHHDKSISEGLREERKQKEKLYTKMRMKKWGYTVSNRCQSDQYIANGRCEIEDYQWPVITETRGAASEQGSK